MLRRAANRRRRDGYRTTSRGTHQWRSRQGRWYKLKSKVRRKRAGSVVRGGEDMKPKFLGAVTVALLILLVFAAVASASQATTQLILKDAQDGTIDGNWTSAQIHAALAYIQNNPTRSSIPISRESSRTTLQACSLQENKAASSPSPAARFSLSSEPALASSGQARSCVFAERSCITQGHHTDGASFCTGDAPSVLHGCRRLSVRAAGAPLSAIAAPARRPRSPARASAARRRPAR